MWRRPEAWPQATRLRWLREEPTRPSRYRLATTSFVASGYGVVEPILLREAAQAGLRRVGAACMGHATAPASPGEVRCRSQLLNLVFIEIEQEDRGGRLIQPWRPSLSDSDDPHSAVDPPHHRRHRLR